MLPRLVLFIFSNLGGRNVPCHLCQCNVGERERERKSEEVKQKRMRDRDSDSDRERSFTRSQLIVQNGELKQWAYNINYCNDENA